MRRRRNTLPANQGPVESRLLFVLQLICAIAAISSLPATGQGAIAPAWLGTFILPSALFVWLGTDWRARYFPTWMRPVAGTLLLLALAWLSYDNFGALDKKSTLACSLLPAMSYFTLRREPTDTGLSLFLSFCFLLIGIMLNRDQADWTMLVFVVCCTWALQIEAKNRGLLRRHATRGKLPGLAVRLLQRGQMSSLMLLIAFALHFSLDLLPSPGEGEDRGNRADAGGRASRQVGLSDTFDLRGSAGVPLNMRADRILRAQNPDGRIGDDLYLRYSWFDLAGPEVWGMAVLDTLMDQATADIDWPEFTPGLKTQRLRLAYFEPFENGELLIPPGVRRISGPAQLRHAIPEGYYQRLDNTNTPYELIYQRPHLVGRIRARIDPILVDVRHTQIPQALDGDRLSALAAELLAGMDARSAPPMAVARRLSAGLEARYSYQLREPEGSSSLSIERFLYESRAGYCMHFATALCLMLRKLDIPSRIAVGLQGGDRSRRNRNEMVFGSQHAHAWVELPLNRLGWTLIDPTPAAHRSQRGWPRPEETKDEEQTAEEAAENPAHACFTAFFADPLSWLRDPFRHLGGILMLAGLCLSICLLALFLRNSAQRRRAGAALQVQDPRPDQHRAHHLMEQLLKALRRAGLGRSPRMTMEQYLAALEQQHRELPFDALRAAIPAYQEVRFGAHPLDPEREQALRQAILWARALPRPVERRKAG